MSENTQTEPVAASTGDATISKDATKPAIHAAEKTDETYRCCYCGRAIPEGEEGISFVRGGCYCSDEGCCDLEARLRLRAAVERILCGMMDNCIEADDWDKVVEKFVFAFGRTGIDLSGLD